MIAVVMVLLMLLAGSAEAAVVKAAQNSCGGFWSHGATWSTGKAPEAGDYVQIDNGCTVVYDLQQSPNIAEVNIEGSLVFALDKSTELSVSLMIVEPTGRLEIGTVAQPLPAQHTAVIKLVDLPDLPHVHMHGQARISPALHTHGGTLTLVGTVAADVLVDRANLTKLLTRNIKVISAAPTGRRGHVMIAHGFFVADTLPLPPLSNQVKATIVGVEFADLGRAEPGVYPVHFHRLGNAGRDVTFSKNSIHHSQNLCIRVHTTNFLVVKENVCYDIVGHGIATEDGSEMYNSFVSNVVMKTKKAAVKTNPNDSTDINEGSGFWLNNPTNSMTGNTVDGAEGWGYQVDPAVTGTDPIVGKKVAVVDILGTAQQLTDVTTLPLGLFQNNTVKAAALGGTEVTNLSGAGPYSLKGLTASGLTQHALQTFVGGQTVIDGLRTDGTVALYDPGNFFGIALQPVHALFKDSPLKLLTLNYQLEATISFVRSTLTKLSRTVLGVGQTIVVSMDQQSLPQQLQLNMQQFAPNTTTQHELYFFDADGPGKHIKLIPGTAVATDNLTYGKSRYFPTAAWPILPDAQQTVTAYQEASFTGAVGTGPALTLPFRIRAGISPSTGADWATGTDLIDSSNKRWRVSNPYVKGPPETSLARYGSGPRTGAAAEGSLYRTGSLTDLYGAVAVARGPRTVVIPMMFYIDLPNSTYHVDLHMIEMWAGLPSDYQHAAGWRVFTVKAEGQAVLTNVDVFREVGEGKPLVKSFDVVVADGTLSLGFSPYGMVSGIVVCTVAQVSNGKCQ